MSDTSAGPTPPGLTHHSADLDDTTLHYVSAGTRGSPVLLVHGFPETWQAFRDVIAVLAADHRVFAVDLRGFGDSAHQPGTYDSATSAADLHQLIAHLGVGPVHLTGQDISGAAVFRLATTQPGDVLSLTAIEMGLPGFGLEGLADITHGGAWHIGALTTPDFPETLLAGRERDFLRRFLFDPMTATPGAVPDTDLDEYVRTYAGPDGWRGAVGLYRSMLTEGPEITGLARDPGLHLPVLAIGAGGGPFTHATMSQAASGRVESVTLDGVGHYAAIEAPEQVAAAILAFVEEIDRAPADHPDPQVSPTAT